MTRLSDSGNRIALRLSGKTFYILVGYAYWSVLSLVFGITSLTWCILSEFRGGLALQGWVGLLAVVSEAREEGQGHHEPC